MLRIYNAEKKHIMEALQIVSAYSMGNIYGLVKDCSTPRRQMWSVKLKVANSAGNGARIINGRRSVYPCRHAHKVFLGALYKVRQFAVVYNGRELYTNDREYTLAFNNEPAQRPGGPPLCTCQLKKGGA